MPLLPTACRANSCDKTPQYPGIPQAVRMQRAPLHPEVAPLSKRHWVPDLAARDAFGQRLQHRFGGPPGAIGPAQACLAGLLAVTAKLSRSARRDDA